MSNVSPDPLPPPTPRELERESAHGGDSVLDAIEWTVGASVRLRLREPAGPAPPLPVPEDAVAPERCGLFFHDGSENYRVLGELARGQRSGLWRLHDSDLGRVVALKVLDADQVEDPAAMRRFLFEAQIGAQLQHPGTVPVYEFGLLADDRPYFTMKLLGGRTLARELAEREGPAARRSEHLAVLEKVCQTLAYGHSRGVVHGDPEPSNVLIGRWGDVYVLDWGLARLLDRADAPPAGTGLGSPAYMAPELFGEGEARTPRSDVFALGAILCELLTGKAPYTGDDERLRTDAAAGHLDEARARLAASGADEALLAICRRALSAAPEERQADAGELGAELAAHSLDLGKRAEAARLDTARAEERFREAELATQMARARTAAERKARRLTLALGVVVAVALSAGALAFLARERDLGQDRVALAHGVSKRLEEAAALRAEARRSEAIAALGEAQLLVDGGPADAATRQRVSALLAEVEAELEAARRAATQRRLDELLQAELDALRPSAGELPDPRAAAQLDAAFGAAFAAGQVELEDPGAAAQLAARLEPIHLSAALDRWLTLRLAAGGDPDRSARLVDLASALDPDVERGHLRELLLAGETEALEFYAAEAELEGLAPESLLLLAGGLEAHGRLDPAAAVLRAAATAWPQRAEAHFALARLGSHARPADLPAAVRAWAACAALRPLDAEVHRELGRALARSGRDAEARAELCAALDLAPEDALALAPLAQLLLDSGQGDQAASLAARARHLAPEHPEVLLADAACDARVRGEPERALESLEAALLADPDLAGAQGLLGRLLLEQGADPEDAAAALELALDEDPGDRDTRRRLARLLEDLGRPGEALVHWRLLHELDPLSRDNARELAAALTAAGSHAEALAAWRAVCDLAPGDPRSWEALAEAHRALGDEAAAAEALRASLDLDPYRPEAYELLAELWRGSGDWQALVDLRRAQLDLAGAGPRAEAGLGEALLRSGRWVEAAAVLEASLAASADPREPRTSLLEEARDREIAETLLAELEDPAAPLPARPELCVQLARRAFDSSRYDLAARLYRSAFAADPDLLLDLESGLRQDAARAAAAAGLDPDRGDPPQRALWRSQARAWLADDLALHRLRATGPSEDLRGAVLATLTRWQGDPLFTRLRHPPDLADLPLAERNAWLQLWAEVAAIRVLAGG